MNGSSDFMSGFMTGQNSDRNGMWGGDGSWIWIILLFALFGGNGFGNRVNEQVDIDTRFLERDIFNTNQNVSNTACQTQREVLTSGATTQNAILENRYTTQLGLSQLGATMQNCCCETQKEILQNRFDNALQTNTLQAQISECCCNIRAESLANTQKIIDVIQQDKIEQLREQVNASNMALNNANLANQIINSVRPVPTPCYVTCSPYQSANSCGFRNGSCGC